MSRERILNKTEKWAKRLKALAHPHRLVILCFLSTGEKNVSELCELCGISQSAISQALARLKLERLVESRRRGHFIVYRASDPRMQKFIEEMDRLLSD